MCVAHGPGIATSAVGVHGSLAVHHDALSEVILDGRVVVVEQYMVLSSTGSVAPHNYAAVEEHFGERVVVHRKGAVRAVGTVAIPGSMGSHTWIGAGLCEPESSAAAPTAPAAVSAEGGEAAAVRAACVEGAAQRDVRLFKAEEVDVAEEAPEAYKDIER